MTHASRGGTVLPLAAKITRPLSPKGAFATAACALPVPASTSVPVLRVGCAVRSFRADPVEDAVRGDLAGSVSCAVHQPHERTQRADPETAVRALLGMQLQTSAPEPAEIPLHVVGEMPL